MSLTQQDLEAIKGIVQSEVRSEISGVREDVQVLQKDVKDLKSGFDVLGKDVKELKTGFTVLQKDGRELNSGFLVLRQEMKDIRTEISGLREQIQQLTITLDNFLKRLTDHEDEFKILRAEVDQIKSVIKQKFGIQISLQG